MDSDKHLLDNAIKLVENFGNDVIASMSLASTYDTKEVAFACVEVTRWIKHLLNSSIITKEALRELYFTEESPDTYTYEDIKVRFIDNSFYVSKDFRGNNTYTVLPTVISVCDLVKFIIKE